MAWELLLNSDYGLMSLAVIVGVVIIGAVMGQMYAANVKKDMQGQGK